MCRARHPPRGRRSAGVIPARGCRMFRRVLRSCRAGLRVVSAAAVRADRAGSRHAVVVSRFVWRRHSRRIVRVVNEQSGTAVEAVSDARARIAPELAPGRYGSRRRSTGSNRRPARSSVASAPVAELTSRWSRRDSPKAWWSPRGASRKRSRRCRFRCRSSAATWSADTGAFNVNRLKELVPTVQFYSSNPRNSAINIRGLGAPFGLTNDGIEPGVGLYIDGVFFARPAAATLDFLDVERIEVLRGPQGTLFGKNTTAGAINVTTRKPSFTRGDRRRAELRQPRVRAGQGVRSPDRSVGDGRGPRVVLRHDARGHRLQHGDAADDLNGLNNLGFRGQLLVRAVRPTGHHGRRRPHAAAAARATRRSSPASRRRCARPTASTRRSPPTSATRRRASTRSTG